MSAEGKNLAQTVKAMRPMLPAKNFGISRQFYTELGFRPRRLTDRLIEINHCRNSRRPCCRCGRERTQLRSTRSHSRGRSRRSTERSLLADRRSHGGYRNGQFERTQSYRAIHTPSSCRRGGRRNRYFDRRVSEAQHRPAPKQKIGRPSSQPHDRKRRRSSRFRHFCRHYRLLKRGPSFGLRLATRFSSTSGTAKHLAIGAGPQT
jgi:hypothetical protein